MLFDIEKQNPFFFPKIYIFGIFLDKKLRNTKIWPHRPLFWVKSSLFSLINDFFGHFNGLNGVNVKMIVLEDLFLHLRSCLAHKWIKMVQNH